MAFLRRTPHHTRCACAWCSGRRTCTPWFLPHTR
uniref:Uncharacterized protein n=1 Tax=Arundo donax TaxID=35708 RepID=A0A0A8ZY75_ARUDO